MKENKSEQPQASNVRKEGGVQYSHNLALKNIITEKDKEIFTLQNRLTEIIQDYHDAEQQIEKLEERITYLMAVCKRHIKEGSKIATLQQRIEELEKDIIYERESRNEYPDEFKYEMKDHHQSIFSYHAAFVKWARTKITDLEKELSEEKAKHGQIAEKAWNENTGALIRVLTPKNGIRGAITAIRLITKLGHLHDKEKKNYLKQFNQEK